MDWINQIKQALKDYKKEDVDIYTSYLKSLGAAKKKGELANPWFNKVGINQYVDAFKKVAKTGVYIDGEDVTLNYRKGLVISYGYQAYKNRLLLRYPESIIDLQLVRKDDSFSFFKENGKVMYKHVLNSPFTDLPIIGVYCIIKNRRGEFIENLSMKEVDKMKNVSKMDFIWRSWEGEMVLKSAIKRACKRHFKDAVKDIEEIDNEGYELENVNVDRSIQQEIQKCTTIDELEDLYKNKNEQQTDKKTFLNLLTQRKEEIIKEQKTQDKKKVENENS